MFSLSWSFSPDDYAILEAGSLHFYLRYKGSPVNERTSLPPLLLLIKGKRAAAPATPCFGIPASMTGISYKNPTGTGISPKFEVENEIWTPLLGLSYMTQYYGIKTLQALQAFRVQISI